ncbi:hypothetical protein HU200_035361 [Digitaria exilis]|uniref:Uncharacterized protein n=1 Tax=Digitaria exilis TaxID=1010633 RepID=A0A835BMZ1_9POAL|nr:hypothetical protein HU200_035361 [Digitaria exilis]
MLLQSTQLQFVG